VDPRPSCPTTTSRRPSRRAHWRAPTSSPIPHESRKVRVAEVDDERYCVLLDVVEVLAELRCGLEVELAPEPATPARPRARRPRTGAKGGAPDRDARRAQGRVSAATRATPAGTKIQVAQGLHARREEHGADDRRGDEHDGRQPEPVSLKPREALRRLRTRRSSPPPRSSASPGSRATTTSSIISPRSEPSRRRVRRAVPPIPAQPRRIELNACHGSSGAARCTDP
jgi:hypothetical protein